MSLAEIENKFNQFVERVKPGILKVIGIEWDRTVNKNFEAGGRPTQWEPRKKISKKQRGKNILVISGALKNYSTTVDVPASTVTLVPDPRARDYSKIHDQGGVINIPAGTKKFRNKKTASGKTRSVFASNKHKKFEEKSTKAYTVNIPKREHTNIPLDDFNTRWFNSIKQFLKL